MRTFLFAITAGFLFSPLASCVESPTDHIPPVEAHAWTIPKKTMRAFRSEQELASYFKELAEKQKLERQRMETKQSGIAGVAPTASVAAEAMDMSASKDDESITNVQHAGVAEGGIVKLQGG